MYIVIFCSLLAVMCTYFESIGKMKHGMLCGFILVTFLGAIHYDYGNDYMSYYNTFKKIANLPFDFSAIMNGDYYREPGWTILCMLFSSIGGFFAMVAVLNVIQNFIIFQSIKNHVDREWWPLSVFVYLFSTSLYLMEFTMMRQFFVMCIFLYMWPYIYDRKWCKSLIVFFLCSYIHSSSVILIPFAFWGFFPISKIRFVKVLYVLVFFILFFSPDMVNRSIQFMVNNSETIDDFSNTYEHRTDNLSLGIGFVFKLLPVFLTYLYINNHKIEIQENLYLILMAAIGYFVIPFAWIIPLAGRLGMYFEIYKLITLQNLYSNLKDKNIRFAFLLFFVLFTSYDYIKFFSNPVWELKFSEFHTIFEVL